MNLAIKDVGHGIACAKNGGTTLELGELTLAHLEAAKVYADRQGGRSLDSSSVYGVIRERSGLDFETDFVKQRDRKQPGA